MLAKRFAELPENDFPQNRAPDSTGLFRIVQIDVLYGIP